MRDKRDVVSDMLISMSFFHDDTELGDSYADLHLVIDAILDAPDRVTSEEWLKFLNALVRLPDSDLLIVRLLLREVMQ